MRRFVTQINDFFDPKTVEKYNVVSLRHKEGIVLYGKAGTGKTGAIKIAMQQISDNYNILCLDFTDYQSFSFIRHVLKALHEKYPTVKKVVFIDECEVLLKESEQDFLYALDGAEYMDSVMFLGCTNKFEEIPKRLLRPSRIGTHIEIKGISQELAVEYIQTKYKEFIPKNIQDMLVFYSQEQEMTVDHFKDICKNIYLVYDFKELDISSKKMNEITEFVNSFKYEY